MRTGISSHLILVVNPRSRIVRMGCRTRRTGVLRHRVPMKMGVLSLSFWRKMITHAGLWMKRMLQLARTSRIGGSSLAALPDRRPRRFDAKEEELKARSIGQKQARGGKFDYPHKALSAVNEARYIIDDLIPDFKQAFPDREIPAYRFKNKAKTATLDSTENDDLLLETFIFGDADVSDAARRTLGTRAFNREEAHLAALIRTAGEYRTRYLDRLAGRV